MDAVGFGGDSGDGWDMTRLTQVIAGAREVKGLLKAYVRLQCCGSGDEYAATGPIRSHTQRGVCVGGI